MLRKFLSAFFIFTMTIAMPAMASDQNAKVTVDKENLKQLIETLESETARTEFIGNLKTLSEVEDGAPGEAVPVPITQKLGIHSTTERLLNEYRGFLAKNDLNSSVVGRTGLSLLALMFAVGAIWLIRRVCRSLHRRLTNLRQKIGVSHNRYKYYIVVLRFIGYLVVGALYVYSIMSIWTIADFAFLKGETSGQVISGALSMFLVVAVGIAFWETISGSIDYGVRRANDRKAGRMRTLLPIIKNVLFIMFAILFALMLLSELGINILPLLAGAGIVGVAIGFGAQKLVQDFIGGFSIILEDLFHVGDVVMIAGVSGVVEEITLRKVQLRDVNGAVFTIPYSEITVIRNLTKDFSYYVLDLNIAYADDTEKVSDIAHKVGEAMRRDEAYTNSILEPVEIMGIERFDPNGTVVLRMRLKTPPAMQWATGREFNLRLKKALQDNNIDIPVPHQTVYYREGKPGPRKPAEHQD